MYFQPLFLLVLAATYKIVFAIDYYRTPSPGICPSEGRIHFCETSQGGGLCASREGVPWTWCCIPNEPVCGSWGQTCSGGGNLAGPGQVRCSAGGQTWCCVEEHELCVGPNLLPGMFNWCVGKDVDNPFSDISVASGLILQSIYFASTTSTSRSLSFPSSSTTSSAVSTSASVASTSASTFSTSQSSSETTGSLTSPLPTTPSANPTTSAAPPASNTISNGAIGGIVAGGVAGMAMIAAAIFFGLRQRNGKETRDLNAPAVREFGAESGLREHSDVYVKPELPDQPTRVSELA